MHQHNLFLFSYMSLVYMVTIVIIFFYSCKYVVNQFIGQLGCVEKYIMHVLISSRTKRNNA